MYKTVFSFSGGIIPDNSLEEFLDGIDHNNFSLVKSSSGVASVNVISLSENFLNSDAVIFLVYSQQYGNRNNEILEAFCNDLNFTKTFVYTIPSDYDDVVILARGDAIREKPMIKIRCQDPETITYNGNDDASILYVKSSISNNRAVIKRL